MDKASGNIAGPAYFPCSFHSTGEFSRGFYKNHCGPTAITNLIVTALQAESGERVPDEKCREIFETVATHGRRRLVYNRRYGTTDVFLWFFVRSALKKAGADGMLRPASRHTLSAKNARRVLERGSFLILELFGHPKYGWHQMVVYGTDENGLFIAADGFTNSPVLLDDNSIGRGLFLEIRPLAET